MDEMRSFYQDKKHQIWLRRAIDHESGEAIAFWFGTREHENLDKLLELLEIGSVYTDGAYAYYECFSSEVLTVTKKNTQKRDMFAPIVLEHYRIIYGKKENLDAAPADYGKALALSPCSIFTYYNRGKIYARKGDAEAAFEDFTKAIKLDPADADIFYDRGCLCRERSLRRGDSGLH
jgi:tetratricopeptide (TPR) repeat protein